MLGLAHPRLDGRHGKDGEPMLCTVASQKYLRPGTTILDRLSKRLILPVAPSDSRVLNSFKILFLVPFKTHNSRGILTDASQPTTFKYHITMK